MANTKQIKENNVTKKKPREVDPGFPVRKGRADASQAIRPRFDPEDDDYLLNSDDVDITFVAPTPDPSDLMAPEGVEVVSQTARMNAEGRIVVDVVLDLGPPAGATGYDIRVGVTGSL